MENYVRYSLMGGPIKMKSGVVPHIFACQPDRLKRTSTVVHARVSSEKQIRRAMVDDILSMPGCSSWTGNPQANTSLVVSTNVKILIILKLKQFKFTINLSYNLSLMRIYFS